MNNQQDSVVAADAGKSTYILVILVTLVVFISGGIFVYYCRKKISSNGELPDILYDSAGDPLSPKPNRIAKATLVHKGNRKDPKLGMDAVRMSALNGSSIGSSYDRSHITGIYYFLEIIRLFVRNFFYKQIFYGEKDGTKRERELGRVREIEKGERVKK